MGLSDVLARWATSRPHTLLVASPGTTATRLAVERWCRGRGAVLAASPNDADVLAVTEPADGVLASAVEELWRQMPDPRAQVRLAAGDDVECRLDQAVAELMTWRPETPPTREDEWVAGRADDEADGHDMSNMAGMDHDAHGAHDMGGTEMPGGLQMADRADDRDGLTLDAVPVALGPVLSCWPTGLVVDVVLQGDLVQQATVRPFDVSVVEDDTWPHHPAAARLDRAADLLALLGWAAVADEARDVRDLLLTSPDDESIGPRTDRVGRRVRRSHVVRSALTGLAVMAGSDARARLISWLSDDDFPIAPAASLEDIVALMVGRDLADARLVMASLPPDLSTLAPRRSMSGGHGA